MISQDISDLHDDGFEGSNEELCIAQEVFYGYVAGVHRKSCGAGVSNSASEENKIIETSVCSQTETSVATNQIFSKKLCQKDNDTVMFLRDCVAQNSVESSLEGARIEPNVHAKKIRLSVNELSNFKPYIDKAVASCVPVKQAVFGTNNPVLQSACPILTCHVVESSREGLASTCYLLKQPPILEGEGTLADECPPSGCLSGSDGSEGKQVGAHISVASPISQESSAMKVLVSSPTDQRVSKSGLLQGRKRKPKRDACSQFEDVNVPSTSEDMKDSRALIQSRVFRLLKGAGWNIEMHKRGRGRYRYLYRSPDRNLLREFRMVWNLCGQSLDAHGNYQMTGDDKNWTDVGQFRSDLFDILRYIEDKINDWETKSALAHQWYLLNPFVILVLVERKLHTLKGGNLVKEKQRHVVDGAKNQEVNGRLKSVGGYSGGSVDMHFKNIVCDPSQASDSVALDGGRWPKQEAGIHKSRSIYVSEGNSLRLIKTDDNSENQSSETYTDENKHICPSHLPTNVSYSTSLPHSSCLYDVPIGNADVKRIYEHPEAFSSHQNSCMSSPDYNKLDLDSNGHAKDIVHCSLERIAPSKKVISDTEVTFKERSECKSHKVSDGEVSKLCHSEADRLHINDRSTQLKSVEIQECPLDLPEYAGSSNKVSSSLLEQHTGSKRSKFMKSHNARYHNSFSVKEVNHVIDTEEASLRLQNDSRESQSSRKGMKRKKNSSKKRRSMSCQLKDDDLLISAIMKKNSYKSNANGCHAQFGKARLKSKKKRKSQKSGCRLLQRNLGKGGKGFKERWSLKYERTVFSWLLSTRAIFINEVITYRDPEDGTVVKEGLIMKDGIICTCCNDMFSVSGFKIHSGFRREGPCLNLFIGSGKQYALCQLQGWSAEYKARKSSNRSVPVDEFDKNDDSCGLCGQGGELLCCDNCPSTFHPSCLSAEELPEGSWYCMNCTCQLCGDLANDNKSSTSTIALKCLQCERNYHQGCLMIKGVSGVGSSPWFCSIGCEEIYGGLQSCVGLSNLIADDYSWTLLRCIHDDLKVPSPEHFALKAECNSKLAVAVTIMEECFLSMTDPRTGIEMIPQVVYNWGSEFPRLDYHGFYTAVLEKDDVLISVASIRVHGVAVAEMPLIATCSKYRRQGMCRRLLNSVEKMLISLKVQKLVISAISDLVETWTVGFGFTPVDEEEKRSLRKINLMVFPGSVLLKKTLYANQGTSLIEAQDASSPKGESTKIEACMEGESVSEIMCINTEKTFLVEHVDQLNAKPTMLSDREAVDTHLDGEATAKVEPELLNILDSSECEDKKTTSTSSEQIVHCNKVGEGTDLKVCSGDTIEADVYMSLQDSAMGPEVKLDDGNHDLDVIEDQNQSSGNIKLQDAVDTIQFMGVSTAKEVMEHKLECKNEDNPSSNCTEECLTHEAHAEIPPVAIPFESRIEEAEATSKLRNCEQRSPVGKTDISMSISIEDGVKEDAAAGCVVIEPKSDNQLVAQGSEDRIFNLQKGSSDKCVEHDVPILVRAEVSGTGTEGVK